MGNDEEVRTIVVRHGDCSTKIPFNPNSIQNVEELVVGKLVKHRVFGHGEITNMEADTLEIKFHNYHSIILLRFVKKYRKHVVEGMTILITIKIIR